MAVVLIIYFFNHRYDGLQLWQVQGVPGVQTLVWVLSAISFCFYPATFNLLERAIQKPQVHLYELGLFVTHPQMVGQVIGVYSLAPPSPVYLSWIGAAPPSVWVWQRSPCTPATAKPLKASKRTSIIPSWLFSGRQT